MLKKKKRNNKNNNNKKKNNEKWKIFINFDHVKKTTEYKTIIIIYKLSTKHNTYIYKKII